MVLYPDSRYLALEGVTIKPTPAMNKEKSTIKISIMAKVKNNYKTKERKEFL